MANKPKPIMSQSDFIYELDWNEKVDNFFIDILCTQSLLGYCVHGRSNISPVPIAIDAIRREFGLEFSYEYCMKKLVILEKRYTVFTWMLTVDGVVYDPATNKVHVSDNAWAYIWKTHSSAFDYHTYGESKLDKLATIFGPAKNIEEKEVIEVSSGASEGNGVINLKIGKELIIIDDDTTSDELVHAFTKEGKCKGKEKRISLRQTNLWDYVDYESDNSLSTQFSTANTNMRRVDVILNQARKKPPIPHVSKTSGKMVKSSCRSNDQDGKPYADPENM